MDLSILMDLTPWVRGPYTGVGLSALLSYESLKGLNPNLSGIFRKGKNPGPPFQKIGPLRLMLGNSNSIYHSLDLSLPIIFRSKKVVTIHDCWTLRPNLFQAQNYQEYKKRRLLAAIDSADLIITPTQTVREHLIDFMPSLESRSVAIPFASTYARTVEEGIVVPTVETYLKGRPKFVLMVACLEVRKNHALLLEALKNLELDLVLVGGDGYGSKTIRKQIEVAQEEGLRIHLYSHLDFASLGALYRCCEAIVLPSLDEGFGFPLVEAFFFEKPVLASDIPALREVGGQAPEFFSNQDSNRLAELLDNLSDDTFRETLANRSKQRSQSFSWREYSLRLLEAYDQL